MNRAKKITEWIKFTMYIIMVVIFQILLIFGIVTSNDNKILLYIFLYVIQLIIVILSTVKCLKYLIKGRQEQESKTKRNIIEGVLEIIVEIIDAIK